MLAPALLATVVLFGGALAGAVSASLRVGAATTLDAWRAVLADPALVDAGLFTLRLATATTLVSGLLGVLLGAAVRRTRPLRTLASLPILVPPVLVAVAAVLWLGAGGIAERVVGALPFALVRDPGGWAIVGVHVWKEAPFLALVVAAAWDADVDRRLEAAAALGLGPAQRLRWVVWPAIRVPLLAGATVVAAFVISSFEVPLLVGPTYPPTLAELALHHTRTAAVAGHARAAAVLLVASASAVTAAAAGLLAARRRRG